jgi:antitoxin component YwqK of YwqJK toxin-antitoxin module
LTNHLLILLTIALFGGCTKTIDKDKLQIRDSIAYEINSNKPFTGNVTSKYESGQNAYSASYKDGKLNGEVLEYFRNGQMKLKTSYSMGILDGEALEYFENGQMKLKSFYSLDTLDKEYVEYFPEGGYKVKCSYIHGHLDGPYMAYQSGYLKKGAYKNGKEVGVFEEYNSDKSLICTCEYFEGEPRNETQWDDYGNIKLERIYKSPQDILYRYYYKDKLFEIKESSPKWLILESLVIKDKNQVNIGDINSIKNWKSTSYINSSFKLWGTLNELDFQTLVEINS